MKKAVLFDMDGVIVNSEPFYFQRKLSFLNEQKIPITKEELEAYIGRNMSDILDDKIPSPDIRENVQNAYFTYIDTHPINYASVMRPNLPKLLEVLHIKGCLCALVSSSPTHIIQKALQECELATSFDCIISGQDVEHCKPAPDPYLLAMKQLQVVPKDCLVIEDSCVGISAAKRANCFVLAFVDHHFNMFQDLSDAKIDCLDELLTYL